MEQEDELNWTHKVVGLQASRTFKKRADVAERDLISNIFGDAQCVALQARYTIDPRAPGKYRVSGAVEAQIEQICGVTLEPVVQAIDEPFDVEFRSGVRRNTDRDPNFDALGDDDPEPIEHGEIHIGRFICEVVASAIDPFPRADDAALEQSEAAGAEAKSNPFAVLAQMKDGQKPD